MDITFEKYNSLKKDKQFDLLIESLSLTNRTAQYYVNWDKVVNNVKLIEKGLHTLNYLVGKSNIYNETLDLLTEQQNLIKVIPTLLAIRESKFNVLRVQDDSSLEFQYLDFIKVDTKNIRDYVDFMDESGLLTFLSQEASKSLVDYVYGVEVGLDSNGRKNRSGTFMENIIENSVIKICEDNNLEYLAQATAKDINKKWYVELPTKESKRSHDFAIYNPHTKKLFILEVNYYGGGGSKLKSVSGEFADLGNFILRESPEIEMIWITDGLGWLTAKRPLYDAFLVINNIINLKMVEKGFLEKILLT